MKLVKLFKNLRSKVQAIRPRRWNTEAHPDPRNYQSLDIPDMSSEIQAQPRMETPTTALVANCEESLSQPAPTPTPSSTSTPAAPITRNNTTASNTPVWFANETFTRPCPAAGATLPSLPEEPSTDNIRYLQSEISKLNRTNARQQSDLDQLKRDLERSQAIITTLRASKCANPRKLKKQLAVLAGRYADKEREVEELRAKLVLKGESARVKEVVEKTVRELEANAAEWVRRMEDVGRRARMVERKARGLGMWWTQEEVDEIVALTEGCEVRDECLRV